MQEGTRAVHQMLSVESRVMEGRKPRILRINVTRMLLPARLWLSEAEREIVQVDMDGSVFGAKRALGKTDDVFCSAKPSWEGYLDLAFKECVVYSGDEVIGIVGRGRRLVRNH